MQQLSRKTFLIFHWLISLAIVASLTIAIWLTFYPNRVMLWAGGTTGVLLLASCSIVLGPVLSQATYKPGKKGLLFDIVVIIALQISSVCFGTYKLIIAKPECIVLSANTLYIISKQEFEDYGKTCPKPAPSLAPTYFFMDMPKDKQTVDMLKSMSLTVDQIPLHFRTDLYIHAESYEDLPTAELKTLLYKSAFNEGTVFGSPNPLSSMQPPQK